MSAQTATTNPTRVIHKRRRTWRYYAGHITERSLTYLLAGALAFFAAVPFLWTISTSFKSGSAQVLAMPPQWIPNPLHPENYVSIWQGWSGVMPFQRWLRNTMELTAWNLFGEIFFGACAGYGFARFRFRGRQLLFTLMLSGMLLPWASRVVPTYVLFARLRWTDTYLPLILPNWFGGAYLVFLFRQYFVSIPKELDEAAKLDGAGSFAILWKVILPLAKPIIATAAILVFMGNWNSWLGPLIYLRSVNKLTLAVGMRWFAIQGYSGVNKEPAIAAFGIMMSLPIIVLFFIAQRHFVRGIRLSVSKG
jgi:multiple sugar transport system permease protein